MGEYFEIIASSLFGFAFLGVGIYIIYLDRKIKAKGRKALATVIEIKEVKSQDAVAYKPVFEFHNHRGETIVQELDYSSSLKPKKTPPYQTAIYYLQEKGETKIVLADNRLKLIIAYCMVVVGIVALSILVYRQL